MRILKDKFERFIRNKIYLRDNVDNSLIGIIDFYDGSNDYKIHKYVICITDTIPKQYRTFLKFIFIVSTKPIVNHLYLRIQIIIK